MKKYQLARFLQKFFEHISKQGNKQKTLSQLCSNMNELYEDLQDRLELTPKQDVLFIIGDWNTKVGSQETPRVTGKSGLGVHNEAGQRIIVLLREHTGYSKHPLPTTQEKSLHMDITRRLTPKSD